MAIEVDPDGGLQQERTALAWERTSIATMVVGLLLARFAAVEGYIVFSVVGITQTILGGLMLVWTTRHYNDIQGPIAPGDDVVHPSAARLLGLSTIVFTGVGVALSLLLLVAGPD